MARPSALPRKPSPASLSAQHLTVRRTVAFSYLLSLPPEYRASARHRWPLVVFLHGRGERGSNLARVRRHGLPKLAAAGRVFPFILVAPQCLAGDWWDASALDAFIGGVQARFRVDPRRVYLTGLSMGGFGTWTTAQLNPRRYAALAPICGGGEVRQAAALRRMPVWAFHGADDPVVPVSRSRELVRAIRAAGGRPRLTVYPQTGHNVWDRAYADERLYRWLLAQRAPQRRAR